MALRFRYLLLPFTLYNCYSHSRKTLFSSITYRLALLQTRACSSTPHLIPENSIFVSYLVNSLNLSYIRAFEVSRKISCIQSLEKPQAVVHYFKSCGISEAQIQSVVCKQPTILFADVEKILKPKISLFEEFGLTGHTLAALISQNPHMLSYSLNRTLKPAIGLIRKVLTHEKNRSCKEISNYLFQTIMRGPRILYEKSKLESNILYLESCGVVGSQLSGLLRRQPRLFTMHGEKLEQVVSKTLAMGFPMGSRMLVHGLHSLSCVSNENLNRKTKLFQSFGFFKNDLLTIFRKSPSIIRYSDAKLRSKLEFYINNLKLDKSLLVRHPILLSYNIKDRVFPRSRVIEVLKSRRLIRKDVFNSVMCLSDKDFLEKYVFKFGKDAEKLLLAYNTQYPDVSTI